MKTRRFRFKSRIVWGMVSLCLFVGQPPGAALEEETKSEIERWKGKIQEAELLAPDQKIETLWLGLQNMGMRNSEQPEFPEVTQTYRRIQAILLNLPGHAQWFANEIERFRASPANSMERGTYHEKRYRYLVGILPHLPSPETIRVLGHYLSDDRDPAKQVLDAATPPENSKLACVALSSIGLKNPPQIDKDASNADPVPWRLWYAKIQSGELAFSFVGQDVEYRFTPDGTAQATALHKNAEQLGPEIPTLPTPRSPPAPAPPAVALPPTSPTPPAPAY